MAYNNTEKDNRPNGFFDLFQLVLWAPSTAPGKRAMFKLDVDLAGNVTFMVLTGDPADKEKAKDGDKIKMKVNLWDFEKIAQAFGDVIRSKTPTKECAVEQVWFRFNKETQKRERMDQPRDGNKLFFVKDSDGKIAISLVQYNRPNIEFGFLPDRPQLWMAHGDGSKWTDGEMSQSGARSYHKVLTELHQRVEASVARQHRTPDLYKPAWVPPAGGGNGGGGGYQKNNGGGGGGGYNSGSNSNASRPQPVAQGESDMDDDIPY